MYRERNSKYEYILYSENCETFENNAVFAENWNGEFKVRFKATKDGEKAKKMYEQLCSEVKNGK